MDFVTVLFFDQLYWPLELLAWSIPFFLLTAGICLINRRIYNPYLHLDLHQDIVNKSFDNLVECLMWISIISAGILAELGFIWLLVDQPYLIIIFASVIVSVALYYQFRPQSLA